MKWLRRFSPQRTTEATAAPASDAFERAVARHELKRVDDLWDFIGYVVLTAPDRFPRRDYIPDDEQMTLDVAFEVLRRAVPLAFPEAQFDAKRGWLSDALSRSLAAYRQGDLRGGAHILQDDFQDHIFKAD